MTYEERKAALVEIAKELADLHLDITVEEIREIAEARDILTGTEKGRELSYLSSIPKAAGLVTSGQRVRSSRPSSHGNWQTVWYAPAGQTVAIAEV